METEASDELLPSSGMVTSSEDYYPTVAINALMRTLRDPSMSSHHFEVVRSLFYIFKALGLRSVPYLPKVRCWLSMSGQAPWPPGGGMPPGPGMRFMARCGTETNRMQFVLFGLQNVTFGPCLAAMHGIPMPVLVACRSKVQYGGANRIELVLFGLHNRTFAPCLAANNRIRIPVTVTFPSKVRVRCSMSSPGWDAFCRR
jgi:Domain of unknown function (DUF3385)